MKFENPEILFWLWGLVPAAGILIFGIRQREKILARFADPSLRSVLVPGYDRSRRWIKAGLTVLALGFAVFALAGPRMGFRWEKTTQRGVDIMIALDCSRSMLAGDIRPTRLERAKREIVDLLHLMTSDRAGLVAFAGQAILQCPLTLDHEAFNIFLKVLEPDYLPVGGTNLNAAIETCYSGFEAKSDTQKAIILITDGENTTGPVDEITKKMAEQGIRIFCIGVGDPKGAPIPDPGGGFKKDASGNIIMSRVDESTLEKIASETHGRYVRSVAGDMDLDLIYTKEILGTMERKTLDQGKKKVWEQRFQWFLFPCVLLLLLEFWLPAVKKILPVLVMGVVLGGLSGPAHAASPVQKGVKAYETGDFPAAKKHFIDAQLEHPDDPRLYYNIGTAAYMNKEYEQAEKNFSQAAQSSDPELSHKARFNLANTRYRMGKLEQAAKEYEEILKTFPQDKETRENLDFVKKNLEEQKQQQKQPDKNSENGEKGDKDQQGKQGDQKQDKEQNSDQDKQGQQNQEKSQSGQQNKDQPQSGQNQQQGQQQNGQQEPKPGNENQDRNKSGQAASQPEETQQKPGQAAAGRPGEKTPQDRALESKLNRLEDKPGMALMPMIQSGTGEVEKDW